MKTLIVMLTALIASGARAEGWITSMHHEGDRPLLRPNPPSFYSGNDLWDACDKGLESAAHAMCVAYIVGAADVYARANIDDICLPPNATAGQIADVMTIFLRDYPQLRNQSAPVLILVGLGVHFPCPKVSEKQPNWMSAPLATDTDR